MQIRNKLLLCLSAVALLASCRIKEDVDHALKRNTQIASAAVEKAKLPDKPYKVDTISTKNDIWLGDSSIKVSDGDPLPARFEHDNGITLVGTKPVNLVEIAEQISVLTGIPVRIDDLVLEEVKGGDTSAETETRGQDETKVAANVEENNDPFKYMMVLAHSGKLSALLDQIAVRFSLWWRYKDGVITFYQMENRIYTIYSLPSTGSMGSNMTSGGSASSGDSSASSGVNMQTSVDLALWKQIEDAIKGLLPKNATLAISQGTGTISVTAPPLTLKKVSKYVKDLNMKLARQVAIGVKVIRVQMKDTDTYEGSINAAFKGISKHFSPIHFTNLATGGVTYPTLGIGIMGNHLDPTNPNAIDLEALSTSTEISVVTSASVTTLNNKAAPVQVAETISYIANVEKETDGTGDDKSVTISTTVEKVSNGFTMEILPRILDHGRVILLFSMTITQVDAASLELQPISIGGDAGGSDVINLTLPKVHTRSFIQEVAMTSGSTLVLTGFESVEHGADRGGLGNPNFTLLGGRANSNKGREAIAVLVTPEVLSTPLDNEARMSDI